MIKQPEKPEIIKILNEPGSDVYRDGKGDVIKMPKTRAEKRRLKREIIKQINPPKYGPVTIYKETFERVEGEGQKNVTFKKNYQGRTNIKQSPKIVRK